MKVVSLVPSWTEMLLEAGINVVGRTRFCIHPQTQAKPIPVVGGTKDLDWDKLKSLKADFLILDQEENLQWMQDESPIPTLVTHVTSVPSLAGEIDKLSRALGSEKLLEFKRRWEAVATLSKAWDWQKIPGEIQTVQKNHNTYEKLVYLIWKDPWMTVSRETFIGSVLSQLGASPYLPNFDKKYPEFQLQDFDLETTFFLFSSEPFPFHKKIADLQKLQVQGSIVDGESFSWFGSRSLRFLENAHSSAAY